MLIDEFLPEYDFNETHSILISAAAADIYRAANDIDFSDSFVVRWLFRLRGISGEITLRALRKTMFETLGETLDREMVHGLVGRFWTIGGGLRKIDAAGFKRFETAGYAKAVWNFSLEDVDGDTRLTTETRIKCLDPESRRSFGRYWFFIEPFSGLIRTEMLKVIKRNVEGKVC